MGRKTGNEEPEDNREAEDIMMELANIPQDIRDLSVGLRNNMSSFEKKVWAFMGKEENPWAFLRQWPAEGYFLDFYSQHYNIDLEADGPHHIGREEEDRKRSKILLKKGIRTIRITPADFVRCSKEEMLEYLTDAVKS